MITASVGHYYIRDIISQENPQLTPLMSSLLHSMKGHVS